MFKLSDNASGKVRNAALQILELIKAKIGEQAIAKVLNEINDIKKKKIDEAADVIILDPVYDNEFLNNKKKNAIIQVLLMITITTLITMAIRI
jgi:hypothetical protein